MNHSVQIKYALVGDHKVGEYGMRTGGQKSSCISTTTSAGRKVSVAETPKTLERNFRDRSEIQDSMGTCGDGGGEESGEVAALVG